MLTRLIDDVREEADRRQEQVIANLLTLPPNISTDLQCAYAQSMISMYRAFDSLQCIIDPDTWDVLTWGYSTREQKKTAAIIGNIKAHTERLAPCGTCKACSSYEYPTDLMSRRIISMMGRGVDTDGVGGTGYGRED